MKCKVCGSELEPGAKVCRICGIRVETSNFFGNKSENSSPSPLNKEENNNSGEDITSFFFNSEPKDNINNKINENLNNNFKSLFNNDFSSDNSLGQVATPEGNINSNKTSPISNETFIPPQTQKSPSVVTPESNNEITPKKPVFFQPQPEETEKKKEFKLLENFGKMVF